MAEVLLLPLIQKLERRQSKLPDYWGTKEKVIEVISELRMVIDFLRDKKWEEGTKISYLLADTIDIVHNFLDIDDFLEGWGALYEEIISVHGWIIEVKRRILQPESGGAKIKSAMRSDCCVGEGDEEDIQQLLPGPIEAKGLDITVVRGMVGIGKTTLARQLYNHADVVDGFERRASVCISNELSHREVIMKLIRQVADSDEFQRDSLLEKMKRADNRTLQKLLHERLQGIRYFIVLDDLPREMSFKSLSKALPDEGNGSRVLITTRFLNIRSFNRAVMFFSSTDTWSSFNFFDMKFLDPHKSWQLFLKTIFYGNKLTSDDRFPKYLERRGKKMLTKCGGLPLAIKDVGEQVAKMRQSGIKWGEVLESIDFDSILALLESSYQKLSPIQKLCFLHLGFFKENRTVKVEKLVQFWEVGGMLPEGDHYLPSFIKDLVKESIVEVHRVKPRHKIKRCRINAILHRLSIKKAVEEIGFEILSSNGNNRPSQDPRHRVINCSRDKFNYSTDGDKHIISLFFRGGGYFDTSPSYWKNLEQLRILDSDDFGLRVLPESVGTLVELRYLGLRNNYVEELPYSLGCLKNLEVLDIAQNYMVEMPDIIQEMGSLRHLYMSDVICRKPLKIDALTNLETLTYISAENWTYDEVSGLEMMTRLRELGIEDLDENSDLSKLIASLAKIRYLHSLILRGFRFRSMPCLDELRLLLCLPCLKLDGLLSKLPCASNFPPGLDCLTLVNSRLDEDPMPLLEKLPHLQYLQLRNAYTGQQMVISQSGFPELRGLFIEESWNLRNIQVEKGGMSKLEKLEIKNCPYLETLPEEIGSMTHLKEITMVTTKHTAAKIRNSALISKIGGSVDIQYMV